MGPQGWGPERGPPRWDRIFLLIPPASLYSFLNEWVAMIVGAGYAIVLLAICAWHERKH